MAFAKSSRRIEIDAPSTKEADEELRRDASHDRLVANFGDAVDTWLERPHLIHKKLVGKKTLFRAEAGHREGQIGDEGAGGGTGSGDALHASSTFVSDRLNDANSSLGAALRAVFEKTASSSLTQLFQSFSAPKPFDSVCFDQFIGKKDSEEKVFHFAAKTRTDLTCVAFGFSPNDADDESEGLSVWFVFYEMSLRLGSQTATMEAPNSQRRETSSSLACGPSLTIDVFSDDRGDDKTDRSKTSNLASSSTPSLGFAPKWLESALLERIVKWTKSSEKSKFGASLRLLNVEEYAVNYRRLKEKYGLELARNWPEVTDPQKFVFEDVAIAAYLVTLWNSGGEESEKEKPTTFVDLGCGNGLLVYILSGEGFPGYGLDVRKRKIWDRYPTCVDLRERSVVPSDSGLFPDADWLIGNHSDELTPWIPVIAARSSPTTNFFLLPCCFWDFDRKYVRETSVDTQYRSYLNYIHEVCRVSGFQVEEDVLRIPSTKRFCLVGRRRKNALDSADNESRLKTFIEARSSSNADAGCTSATIAAAFSPSVGNEDPLKTISSSSSSSSAAAASSSSPWVDTFKPREKVEKVRNCSRVDRGLKLEVVDKVVRTLLAFEGKRTKKDELSEGEEEEEEEEEKDEEKEEEEMEMPRIQTAAPALRQPEKRRLPAMAESSWSPGGRLSVKEIAALFSSATLKRLKSECGGIKTLLKNHHQIFICIGDVVRLRDWRLECLLAPNDKRLKWRKTSLCWFNDHHPQGCPVGRAGCLYAHGEADLRIVERTLGGGGGGGRRLCERRRLEVD